MKFNFIKGEHAEQVKKQAQKLLLNKAAKRIAKSETPTKEKKADQKGADDHE